MIRPHPTTTSPAGFSAALGATVLWGIGNVAIARAPIGGLSLAFHRLWIAAVLYGFVLYATGGRLTARSFKYGMPGAIAFAADIGTFFLAIKNTTVADAVTISALQPVVILFVAGALFGEKVRARHLVCTIVAIIGVAAVVRGSSSSGGATIFGEVMAVAALFAWAWYFIASKQARQHLDTLEYLTVVMIGGLPIIAPFALISGELADTTTSWETFGWVMLVVLLPGSGHILINWAHGHSTIISSSLLTLLMPVISTAGAAMWLDQPVTSIQVIGIGVVLSALAIVIVGDARAASLDAESLEEGPRV